MNNIIKHLFTLAGICLLTIVVSSLSATIKWNMPTPYGDGYFHTKNIREFVAEIEKMSNGEIQITVHSGASLFPSTEIFRAVRGGQAEIGELLMANVGNEDPLFNIDSIPFLAVGYEESKKLWDASKPMLVKNLDKMGAVLLYAVPWPPQNFYSKKEIKDADFFTGKKLRTYNAITSQLADLLGASPTTIQVPEIAQAFTTGIIDAMITSGATGVSSQSWDFIDYYTEVQAWMPKNMIFMNKKVWRKLSDKNKDIILKASANAELRGWKYSEQANKSDRDTLASKGIKVRTPSAATMKSMKAVGSKMTNDWMKKAGATGKTVYDNYRK